MSAKRKESTTDCELMISILANSVSACIAEDSGLKDEETFPRWPFTLKEFSYISRVNNAGESLIKHKAKTKQINTGNKMGQTFLHWTLPTSLGKRRHLFIKS